MKIEVSLVVCGVTQPPLPQLAPFHRFKGWKLLALIIVALWYSYWFPVHGPFGKLAALAPGMPLEEAMYYTGEHAVSVLSQLDEQGRKTKFLSLALDVPFMILFALMAEGLIAFGLRHLPLRSPRWNLMFILPMAFLLFDIAEDSFLALTLATGSEFFGTLAGLMTPLKMFTFIPASIAGFIFGLSGLIVWLVRKLHPNKQA